ncbi:Abi family protein [bacterium]|nr:Abi family protein [bacterium]
MKYLKEYKTFKEQTELMKKRGLKIPDEEFAQKELSRISYYRLSAYFYPFFKNKDEFKDNASFENVINLYYFDTNLRDIIFKYLEIIEIYMRTKIAYVISQHNGAFGYTNSDIFQDEKFKESLMEIVEKETKRSNEVFVKEFFKKYNEEKYLPVWAMVEIISLNTLSKTFANLKEFYRSEITKELKIKSFVFKSWLHTLTYIRNICAHHSRLWNKILAIEPVIPKNQKLFQSLNNQKLFFVLSMIQFILISIDDKEFYFKSELKSLLKKYPNVDIKDMGFVQNWEDLEIWRMG